MTASSRTILLRVPVDKDRQPTLSCMMFEVVTECDALGDAPHEITLAALRAAPRVTEDEIVRARVVALPRYEDDDIPMVRDVVAIESFFLPRDELLRALGVPDVAKGEKEQKP